MIFVLVLRAALGPAIVGHFDSEDECKAAAVQYVKMLTAEQTKPAQMACVGFPKEMLVPKREDWADGGSL